MAEATNIDGWMRALAGGDRSVFTALYRALRPPVLEVCRRMLPGFDDAEDAAQTALLRIFERTHQYDPSRPALPWALGIAAWESRTLRRKRQRAHEVPEGAAGEGHDAGEAAEVLEQRELEAVALAALGTLSEADRAVLVDTYWDRAVATGATVRKRRQRALDRLRAQLRRLYGFE